MEHFLFKTANGLAKLNAIFHFLLSFSPNLWHSAWHVDDIGEIQQRIMDSAEQAALSESDLESGASKSHGNGFYDARRINEYQSDGRLAEGSRQMLLRHMRRFEGYPVNISLSAVLMANGVTVDGKDMGGDCHLSAFTINLFGLSLNVRCRNSSSR